MHLALDDENDQAHAQPKQGTFGDAKVAAEMARGEVICHRQRLVDSDNLTQVYATAYSASRIQIATWQWRTQETKVAASSR